MSKIKPLIYNPEDLKHISIVEKYTDVISSMNTNIFEDFNRELTAKEAFGLFVNQVGSDNAKKQFIFFKKAFEKSGIEDNSENWNVIYIRYFGDTNINFNLKEDDEYLKDSKSVKYFKFVDFKDIEPKAIFLITAGLGFIMSVIIGSIFPQTKYYKLYKGQSVEVSKEISTFELSEFNYLMAIICFILVSVISYLYFNYKRQNKQ